MHNRRKIWLKNSQPFWKNCHKSSGGFFDSHCTCIVAASSDDSHSALLKLKINFLTFVYSQCGFCEVLSKVFSQDRMSQNRWQLHDATTPQTPAGELTSYIVPQIIFRFSEARKMDAGRRGEGERWKEKDGWENKEGHIIICFGPKPPEQRNPGYTSFCAITCFVNTSGNILYVLFKVWLVRLFVTLFVHRSCHEYSCLL